MPVKVGVSELPGRTFGKVQYMSDVQAGANLVAALAELRREHGEIVTVNEADRPRPDQWDLRRAYIAFLNGGPWAALAAYCELGPHPDEFTKGTWTSTHDPGNYGNAGDLGGPDGAVITENARQLLDGNHSRGVIGRKYGLYNTGWFFSRREIWHFNIYVSRASVLAPMPGSPAAPQPNPKQERYLMIFTDEIPDKSKPKERKVTIWDGARSVMLSSLNGYDVDGLIKLVRKQQKATIDSAVRLEVRERQTIQALYRKMK